MTDVRAMLDVHMPLQRRWWRAERVCWVLMLVGLCAAVAGAAGNGLFDGRVTSDGAVSVEYQCVARADALTDVRVRVGGVPPGGMTVVLGGEFRSFMWVEGVSPEPEAERTSEGELQMLVNAGSDAEVRVRLRPVRVGRCDWTVQVLDAAGVRIGEVGVSQVVLP